MTNNLCSNTTKTNATHQFQYDLNNPWLISAAARAAREYTGVEPDPQMVGAIADVIVYRLRARVQPRRVSEHDLWQALSILVGESVPADDVRGFAYALSIEITPTEEDDE